MWLLPVFLFLAGSVAAAVVPTGTAPGSVDLTGSWELSIDCDLSATATSFVTITQGTGTGGTGALTVSTPPVDCGTLEVPGGMYEIATCASTPDPRDGLLDGLRFDSPTTGYYTSDARAVAPFKFTFTDCLVTRLVTQHHFGGTVVTDEAGKATRIVGTMTTRAADFYDADDAVCFSVPSTPDCKFEMRRNDVAVGRTVTVSPLDRVTVTFDTVTSPGTVSVTPVSTPTAAVPANFFVYTAPGVYGAPPVPIFYQIHTTAEVSGPITSCFGYPDATGDGIVDGTTPPLAASDLRVLHAEEGNFVDRTLSLDLIARVVCARTPSLSQLVVGGGSVGSPRPAGPFRIDGPVSGASLTLRSTRLRGRPSVRFVTRDPHVPFPVAGSADDPRMAGAVLEVLLATGERVFLTLAQSGWSTTTDGSAFKYRGARFNAVRLAIVDEARGLTVVAHTKRLPLRAPIGAVAVRFTMGALRICTVFARGSVRRDTARRFVAVDAPTPAILECSDAALTAAARTPE